MQRRDLIELAIAVAVVAAVAVFGTFVEKGALRDGIIRLCAVGLYAMSLNMLVGYTGMLSFGHAMFYGVGAYAFCLLVKSGAMGIPLALVLALLITGAVATIVGTVCVRTTRVYFSFITLAIGMLFYSTVVAWNSFTGGEQGLSGIPRQPFFGIDLNSPFQYLMVSVILFVVGVLVLRHILNSPFGASLRMIRDNPQRCVFLGINVLRVKLIAFVISSVFAALGGVLMSLYVSGAYPNFAYWTTSGEGLFMITLGGVNVFLGPAFGAGMLLALESVVNEHTSHHGIVLGTVILVVALGLRKGLLEFMVEHFRQARSGRVPPPAEAECRAEVAANAPAAPLVTIVGERR
jgi:branched-chain amino acid transport system permease protein